MPSSKKCGTRLTYFTPGWSKVHCITMPYNRIDEKVEASDSYPEHVETCARIPCLHVPRQRKHNET